MTDILYYGAKVAPHVILVILIVIGMMLAAEWMSDRGQR
jgi:hypothetical protein